MGWELEELEEAALLVSEEQQMGGVGGCQRSAGEEYPVESLTNQMQQTHLQTKPLIEVLNSTQECSTSSDSDDTSTGTSGSITNTGTSSCDDSGSNLDCGPDDSPVQHNSGKILKSSQTG